MRQNRQRIDLWWPGGRWAGRGMDWELGISRCKLINRINNKVLLYCTMNYILYPMINHNRKESITLL